MSVSPGGFSRRGDLFRKLDAKTRTFHVFIDELHRRPLRERSTGELYGRLPKPAVQSEGERDPKGRALIFSMRQRILHDVRNDAAEVAKQRERRDFLRVPEELDLLEAHRGDTCR